MKQQKLVQISENVWGIWLYSWMPAKATAGVQDCECGHTLWWSQSAYACGRCSVWEGAKCGLSKKVSKRNVFTPQTLSVIHLSVTWRGFWRVQRRWLETFIKKQNENIRSCNKVLTLTYEESIINLWSRRNKWDEKINFNQYKSERRRIR